VIQPGESWNSYYQTASCGEVLSLAQGTHPSQNIVENAALNACTQRVVFQPVDGASVTVSGSVTLGGGSGFRTDAPSHIALRGFSYPAMIHVWGDASDILVDGVNGGGVNIEGANGVTVRNSDFGPCDTAATNGCERVFVLECRGCGAGQGITQNVLFEGNTIHDYSISNSEHFECVYTTGGTNVTFRGNKFWACDTYDLAIGMRGDVPAEYHNWLVENNWFGRAGDNSPVRASAVVFGGQLPATDTLVRFNSFAPGQTVTLEGPNGIGAGIRIVGNLLGNRNAGCIGAAIYVQNVQLGGGCGPSDTGISALPYVNDSDLAPMNYHLSGPSVADGFVTLTNADASLVLDIDGSARNAPRDAGSDER
jgi:hypothetical protein